MFSTQLTTLWRCVQLHGEPPLVEGVRQRLEPFQYPTQISAMGFSLFSGPATSCLSIRYGML